MFGFNPKLFKNLFASWRFACHAVVQGTKAGASEENGREKAFEFGRWTLDVGLWTNPGSGSFTSSFTDFWNLKHETTP
jgi:hypothetical protein